jgi:hypothetical protein
VVAVAQRIIHGTPEIIAAVLTGKGGGQQVNAAFIERWNATVRACRCPHGSLLDTG